MMEARKKQVLRRRFEARELLMSLKSGPCTDCGNKFHHCQMDLISRDGDQEDLTMSGLLNRSKARMLEAAKNRDLVCANCGRLRTWRRNRAARMGRT